MQQRNLLKEFIMTTAIFTTAPAAPLRQFINDIGGAARVFAEALFAAQSRQFAASEAGAAQADCVRAKARGRRQLLSLAQQYDSLSPALSAELRTIANRD